MNARKRRRLQYRGTMNTKFRNKKHGIDTFTDSSSIRFSSVHLASSFLGMFRVVWYAVSVINNFPDRNLKPLRNRLLRVVFRMIFSLACVHTVDIGVHIFIRKCPIFMRRRMRQARVLSYVSSSVLKGRVGSGHGIFPLTSDLAWSTFSATCLTSDPDLF